MRKSESGNILFFILVAVILLGFLTMALSRSGTSVNQTGSVEKTTIDNAQIQRYARALESAVDQLRSRGCSEGDISFENPEVSGYENTNNTSDESCFVFSVEGAGQTWKEVGNTDITITPGTNSGIIRGYAITGVETDAGAAGVDLLFLAGISADQCAAINNDFGISGSVATTLATWTTPFLGAFTAVSALGTGGQADGIEGKPTGCITMNDGTSVFYHTILAR